MQALPVPIFVGIAVRDGKVTDWRHFFQYADAEAFYANFYLSANGYSDVRVLRLDHEDYEMEDVTPDPDKPAREAHRHGRDPRQP